VEAAFRHTGQRSELQSDRLVVRIQRCRIRSEPVNGQSYQTSWVTHVAMSRSPPRRPHPVTDRQSDVSREPEGALLSSKTAAIYRGIRGVKHRNDRIYRSVTTSAVFDRPPGRVAGARQPAQRQNVVDQRPTSSHQSGLVQSRRSVSAHRQVTTLTPVFERDNVYKY